MSERFNRELAIPRLLKALGITCFIGAAVLAVLFNVMRVNTVQEKYAQYLVFLSDFEASVASLENKWLIIIVIFLLFILRSLSAVIPYAIIYMTTAMVFPPRQSFLINLVGMVFTAAFRYYTGIQMGEGYLNKILKKNPIISRIFEVDGRGNPIVLLAIRIVPLFPYNTVSQLYGSFEYPFLKYMIISAAALLPRLVSYSFIGNNVYDPLSTAFYLPIILLLIVTGFSFFFLRAILLVTHKYTQKSRKEKQSDEQH